MGQLFLSYVVLSNEVTVLHATMRPALAPPRQRRPRSYRGRLAGADRGQRGAGSRVVGQGLAGELTVTDDRGTTSTASFPGGGSDDEWRGRFEARPPLAPDTAWVEVLDERVGLPSAPSTGVQVRVEPRADADPAHGYLRVRLAGLAEFHPPDAMDTSIEALVAAGALEADDPVIGEVRAVARGYSRDRAPRPVPTLRCRSRGGPCWPGAAGPAAPGGFAVAGATTPLLDGFTVAVLAVRSTDEQFYADVETVPGLPHWHWLLRRGGQAAAGLVGRGRPRPHYLGGQEEWHFSEGRSGGQIEFWPALDPAARVLDIMPTTMAARAVIRVPLDWGEDR